MIDGIDFSDKNRLMKIPSVIHPVKFNIGGYIFEVVSYGKLTDQQAAIIVRNFYSTHKFKKKDVGKVFKIISIIDKDSADIL